MSTTREYVEEEINEKPTKQLKNSASRMISAINENHHFENLTFRIRFNPTSQDENPHSQGGKSMARDTRSSDRSPRNGPSEEENKQESEGKNRFFERLREHLAKQHGAGLLEELCHQPRFLNAHQKVPLEIFARVANLDFSKMKEREILELMTSNKHTSVCLQQLLAVVHAGSDTSPIISCAANNLPLLITDPYGNYVIQKLVARNSGFLRLAENYCVKHFASLYCNEFASRLMQLLIGISPDFRSLAAYFFRENLHACVNGISAVFLATSILRSWNHVNQIDFVIYNLKYDLRESLQSKYMKRILVVYLESAPDSMLETTFELLRFETELLDHLNDKYLAFSFYYFILRGYQPAAWLLRDRIKNNLSNLLFTKHFKYLLIRLLYNPPLKEGCLGSIIKDLQRYTVIIPQQLIRSAEYYLFVTIILTACDGMDLTEALSFAERLKYFEILDPANPSQHPHLASIHKILRGESRLLSKSKEYIPAPRQVKGGRIVKSHECEVRLSRTNITAQNKLQILSNIKDYAHHQGISFSFDEERGESGSLEEELTGSYDV